MELTYREWMRAMVVMNCMYCNDDQPNQKVDEKEMARKLMRAFTVFWRLQEYGHEMER